MNAKYISIVIAFLSGVFLTLCLLSVSRYGQARYAPFLGGSNDIIDVRTGQLFTQDGTVWRTKCQAVNKSLNN